MNNILEEVNIGQIVGASASYPEHRYYKVTRISDNDEVFGYNLNDPQKNELNLQEIEHIIDHYVTR